MQAQDQPKYASHESTQTMEQRRSIAARLSPARVSIIVVNWNGKELLGRCLSSLEKQAYPNFEVILVDNGSIDGSVEYVRTSFPWVRVVRSNTNLGYAGGCNLGATAADGDYIMLLNNDTRLHPYLVQRFVTALDGASRVGVVSGVPVETLEPETDNRGQLVTLNVLGKHVEHRNSSNNLFYAPGACCMYRRGAIPEPYDADYFAYDEDVYMSWFLRLRGFQVIVEDGARYQHWTNSTSRRIWEYVTFCAERNRWTNLLLFYETRTLAKVAIPVFLNITAKIVAGVPNLRSKLAAYLWLVTNFDKLRAKRAKVQSARVVPDSMITRYMSGRVLSGRRRASELVNAMALWYFRVVGLETAECAARQPMARNSTSAVR